MRIAAIFLFVCLTAYANAAEKPYAFGRFGFNNDDGLLTMNVSSNGFEVPGGPNAVWSAGAPRVNGVSATEKTLEFPASEAGPRSARYTLLYPGIETKWGNRPRLVFYGNPTFGVSMNGGPISDPSEAWSTLKSPDLVVMTDRDAKSVPVIVTFSPMARRIRWVRQNTVRRELQVEANGPVDIRFTVPTLEKRYLADAASVKRFIRLVDTQRPIARLLSESYRLDRAAGTVTVTDEFTPANARIVLPPALAFAASHQYPVKRIAAGPLFCKYGPLVFGGANGKVTYTLPVPPTQERGYLAPAKGDGLIPLLNDVCGHWPAAWCRNGVDLGYAGVTNAAMAWNLLNHGNRVKALDAWNGYLDAAFRLPPYKAGARLQPWKTMTEPFSGKSLFWGYSINNKVRQCDLEWGIGLPLYGMYKYGTVTGDWSRVKRNWPAAKRLAGYFDLADDYAWMTVCNAEDGYSTGTGDALNAAYAGMAAMLGMAGRLGDAAAVEKYSYRLSRMALLTSMRPAYTKWAVGHGMIKPMEVALGFWEKSSFTTSSYEGDPWGVTTLLSGDGCMPELMQLYSATQPTAWKGFLDEYASHYPDWYDGARKYDVEVTYNGNSGYVTFPHLFARSWFGAHQTNLREWLSAAQSNRNNAWVGPNAIAEIITQEAPIVLSDWGSAPLPGGTYTDRSAQVHVRAPKTTTLRFAVRKNVTSVRVDGHAVNFSEEDTALETELPVTVARGTHTIVITFMG